MDKSRIEPTIFLIEKISFSLKLFSGHFYGQSFIETVRGPLVFAPIEDAYKTLVSPKLEYVTPIWNPNTLKLRFLTCTFRNENVQSRWQQEIVKNCCDVHKCAG